MLIQSHLHHVWTQRPLTSSPKVAVVERFNCSYCISSVTLLFFFLQSVKGVNRNQWGRYPPHQVLLLLIFFLYQLYVVKCFVCVLKWSLMKCVRLPLDIWIQQHLCVLLKWTIFYLTPLQDRSFLTATFLFFSYSIRQYFLYIILLVVDVLLKQAKERKVDCL